MANKIKARNLSNEEFGHKKKSKDQQKSSMSTGTYVMIGVFLFILVGSALTNRLK